MSTWEKGYRGEETALRRKEKRLCAVPSLFHPSEIVLAFYLTFNFTFSRINARIGLLKPAFPAKQLSL
jgi:hypothetical protein